MGNLGGWSVGRREKAGWLPGAAWAWCGCWSNPWLILTSAPGSWEVPGSLWCQHPPAPACPRAAPAPGPVAPTVKAFVPHCL